MALQAEIPAVLEHFPADCRALRIEPLGGAGGFSGSYLWRIESPRGRLCLRLWPSEHPSPERLEFIHAVLRHVADHGFRRLPLPIAFTSGATYVKHHGRLWELTPWMPGEVDRAADTPPSRVAAALKALAEFHVRAATYRVSGVAFGSSPGLIERRERLERLMGGDVEQIGRSLDDRAWPELAEQGRRYLSLFRRAAPATRPLVERAATLSVPLQPCLRDIWRDNVLFVGDEVSAILDFAAMRVDSVAGDVARLLGSFAVSCDEVWERGLAAYRDVRPLSENEMALLVAFDRSSALMAGISWLDWVFRERRTFPDRSSVIERFEFALARLARLVEL
jgi:homoserine kinase type II